MELIQAIILGTVEGITEFLPISSTGHLILTTKLLGITQTEFVKTFEIAIQLGAIGAVVALFWRRLLELEVLKRLGVAFLPTAVIGFLLYSVIKAYLIGNEVVVVWALLLGGIALILFERWHTEDPTTEGDIAAISYTQSFAIGIFQSLAIIPGVSRSAATIVGGLLLGLPRVTIVEFSFLLAVPTMTAATGLDLIKSAPLFTLSDTWILAVGFFTSFIVALLAIRFLLAFVRKHSFTPFGIYRILIALLFLLFVL